jgi:hypothetical protein
MQKLYFILALLFSATTFLVAQNGLVGTGFSSGWNVPADNNSFSASSGTSRILITPANGTGNQFFRLVRNAGADEAYQNGQFGPIGCTTDTDVSPTEGAVNATEGCGVTAFFINVDDGTDNYVFKTRDQFADPVDFLYFKIEGPVEALSSVGTAQVPTPDANGFVGTGETVSIGHLHDFDGLPVGQKAYIRYTTDGFTTSTVSPMGQTPGIGFFSYDIPPQPDGTVVTWYIFTSGDMVAPAVDGSDTDYRTINLENNGGANYTYTVNRALPVTYASWTGRRVKADAVQLNWATASEDQAATFELECSQNGGQQWMTRTTVAATNQTSGAAYNYLDTSTPIGDLQYRLKQVDIDGNFEYSSIITVAGQQDEIKAWPLPTSGLLHISTPDNMEGSMASLTDLTGRTLSTFTLGSEVSTIDVTGIAPGVYVLYIKGYTARKIVVR